jgi:RNA polymerase sigma-70 factor (ECF subfamily)
VAVDARGTGTGDASPSPKRSEVEEGAAPTPPIDPDALLLERARAGDRAAFGLLVERHHRTLAAVLHQRFGGAVSTDDVLQEVFLKALTGLGGFEGRSSFLTWATTIALRCATDSLRRDARRHRLTPRDEDSGPDAVASTGVPDPLEAVAARDEGERARRALDALAEHERLAVTLRVVEGLHYAEVASRLHVAVPLARTWVSRGLQSLRRSLSIDKEPS